MAIYIELVVSTLMHMPQFFIVNYMYADKIITKYIVYFNDCLKFPFLKS